MDIMSIIEEDDKNLLENKRIINMSEYLINIFKEIF